MATKQEKLEALIAALNSVGAKDDAEAERFLVMFEAMAAFLAPPPAETAEPQATVLVSWQPQTDEHRQKFKELSDATWSLLREVDPGTEG